MRHCSKQGCSRAAMGTLTYDYVAQTAVLGPLASSAEPHAYDLCETHLRNLTVPKGWEVLRLEINYDQVAPSDDDLMELAEAVKEAARPAAVGAPSSFTAFVPADIPGPAHSDRPKLEVVAGAEKTDTSPKPQAGPFGPRDSSPTS